MLLLSSADVFFFSKLTFLGTLYECQALTVWIQIRIDVPSALFDKYNRSFLNFISKCTLSASDLSLYNCIMIKVRFLEIGIILAVDWVFMELGKVNGYIFHHPKRYKFLRYMYWLQSSRLGFSLTLRPLGNF